MSQTQIQKPNIQGVISEPTIGSVTQNRDDEDNDSDTPDDIDGTSEKDEDAFGQKFEIPAFLRKIH
jgi:hypothetical protein